MNRELKFRVWDKSSKIFRGNLYKYLINAHTGELEVWGFSDLYDEWYNTYDDDKDLIVQQYTGLQDKNGKEIYEGDIVLYRKQNREVCIGKFWDGADDRMGAFLQNPEIKHRNFGTNKLSAFTSCEIIGNIFETPELLK